VLSRPQSAGTICFPAHAPAAPIEEMERRHEEDMKRMGGGSGGSM
jgi:hypothetical protein